MTAAIIELDPLTDPVRPAAENDDLLSVRRRRLTFRRRAERGFVGRIHIGRGRGEFGRAGVDALVNRPHAERLAQRPHIRLFLARQRREPRIREARRLERPEIRGVARQPMRPHLALQRHNVGELTQEPGVDFGRLESLLDAHAEPQRLSDLQQPVRRRRADGRAQHIGVVALAEALDLDLVEPGQPRLQRAQSLLQRFRKGPPNRHRLADRLHRGGEHRIGAGEFLEGEARNFRDDVIDRRFERGRRRAPGNVVGDLVQRVAHRQLRRDLGDGESRRLRRQRRGARHARVHLDHDHLAVLGIDRELDVGAAGLDADLAQHRQRGVAHDLIFLVRQCQRRGDGDGIPGMHAHRVDVLDRADDDAIVRVIADHLHLEFLPAEHALLDQHFGGGRSVDPALDDLDELGLVIGDAAAGAAHREARTDDRRQADILQRRQRRRKRLDVMRARRRKTDLGHRLAEPLAILRLVYGVGRRADHLDVVLLQHAHFLQREGGVQRRLPAHGRQQRKTAGYFVALLRNDFGDHLRSDRLDVGPVRHVRVGHDRRRIGIDQHDPITLGLQSLDRLRAGIIEFARLPDDDRPGADDENGRDVLALRHKVFPDRRTKKGRVLKGSRPRGLMRRGLG